ncbi:MAG: hypothetical protein AAFQ41_16830 [Cyanobacteria bacterium J06623_7]
MDISNSDVSVKINFQSETATVPTGYIADMGLGYDRDRGYGWITTARNNTLPYDMSEFGRDRHNSARYQQSLDTLLLIQPVVAWEYDLPNSDYWVTVAAGDSVFAGGKR